MPTHRTAWIAAILLSATLPTALPAAAGPAQSYAYRQKAFGHACPRPLKFAAGACVRRCPAGYRNEGGYCRLTRQAF